LKGDIKEVATLVRCDGKSADEKEAQYDALRKAWKQARMMEAVIEQFSEVFKKLREHEGIGS
jgi:vacuolar-type H+-ATPase catalytic subunit A/Vma1